MEYMNKDTGEILTAADARKQWRNEYDGDDPTNCLSFLDQYDPVSNEEAAVAEIDRVIKNKPAGDPYKYQLLDRLRVDCNYFLANGERNPVQLWGQSVEGHIAAMKRLYNSFPADIRPDWLTAEDIDRYSEEMKAKK